MKWKVVKIRAGWLERQLSCSLSSFVSSSFACLMKFKLQRSVKLSLVSGGCSSKKRGNRVQRIHTYSISWHSSTATHNSNNTFYTTGTFCSLTRNRFNSAEIRILIFIGSFKGEDVYFILINFFQDYNLYIGFINKDSYDEI